jgi:hypothetical protein
MADSYKHQPKWIHADYLRALIPTDQLAKTARLVRRALAKYDYDALACRGVSGLLITPIMAVRLKKSLLVVRKPSEDQHSGRIVEGDIAARRYIILDDFICEGETAKAIRKEIKNFAPRAKCLGVLEVNRLRHSLYRRPERPEETKLRTEWMDAQDEEEAEEAAVKQEQTEELKEATA